MHETFDPKLSLEGNELEHEQSADMEICNPLFEEEAEDTSQGSSVDLFEWEPEGDGVIGTEGGSRLPDSTICVPVVENEGFKGQTAVQLVAKDVFASDLASGKDCVLWSEACCEVLSLSVRGCQAQMTFIWDP